MTFYSLALFAHIVALVLGVVSAQLWRPREARVPMKEAKLGER